MRRPTGAWYSGSTWPRRASQLRLSRAPGHSHVRGILVAAISSAASIPELVALFGKYSVASVPESVAHRHAGVTVAQVGFSVQMEQRKLLVARQPPWQSLLLLVISPVHSESPCECKVVPNPVKLGT